MAVAPVSYSDPASISRDWPLVVSVQKVERVEKIHERGYSCDGDKAKTVVEAMAAQ